MIRREPRHSSNGSTIEFRSPDGPSVIVKANWFSALRRTIWCCITHRKRWRVAAGGDWVHFFCPDCNETWGERR
jgi:hypothetical protein